MIGPAIRLYPAGYRAAYGAEIADIHREMTAGMPRAARLRADADLAAHAARLRFGLHSAAPAGRVFATAAPFALGASAVVHGLWLAWWYAGLVRSPAPAGLQLATLPLDSGLFLLFSVLVCVGAVVALCGRRMAGTAVAVTGLLGSAALGAATGEPALSLAAALTAVCVALACPPGRRHDRLTLKAAGVMTGCAWLPAMVVGTHAFGVSTDYGAWPLLVLAASGAAVALRERSHGLREAAAVALASPPLIAQACTTWGDTRPVLGAVLALGLTVAVPAGFLLLRRRP
ncbi:hypothetical protein [Streptomyces sp. NPDC057910]|uniref:hypothetical protein n=1 Tax=Streptomyces sp. NPDC057910 TaxID=3346278 RepID=UPI0036ED2340